MTTQNHFFSRLADLYLSMDKAWNQTADSYGFQCNGCEDNCCESEFYHYTFIEKDYLLSGLLQLPKATKNRVTTLAGKVNLERSKAGQAEKRIKILCPLNEAGRCILYSYRPMICRLHGIPHELNRAGTLPLRGPGCDAGAHLFNTAKGFRLNRTPFYSQLARLEMDYRKERGLTEKFKLTIAQIISTAQPADQPGT